MEKSTTRTKVGLAAMLRGGVIMDVVNADQARIAEQAGAAAVMALERVPAQIRADGGVARASDPEMIQAIQNSVSIPVMAKCRIGHLAEAQILQALDVDFIDESEVLSVADHAHHIDKSNFAVPFVCGCVDLPQALRRIEEGAAMIRTKGEAGTGDISEAVRHLRRVRSTIETLSQSTESELHAFAHSSGVDVALVRQVASERRLPVPQFAAGGIATVADAALCMTLGAEAVFVGSGIFLSDNPEARAQAIVQAVTHYRDPAKLAALSRGLGAAMRGQEAAQLPESQRLAAR